MAEEQRLKKKVNKLIRERDKLKLAVLEYAISKNDYELMALLSKS